MGAVSNLQTAQMQPDNERMKTSQTPSWANVSRADLNQTPQHINKKSGSERANVHIIPTFSIC